MPHFHMVVSIFRKMQIKMFPAIDSELSFLRKNLSNYERKGKFRYGFIEGD